MTHVQVEPAIPVVVDERGRDTPARIIRAREAGHIGERAVAVVAEHLVPAAEAGEVQVHTAVVVVIAGSHAHPVAGCLDPARVGHVCEP